MKIKINSCCFEVRYKPELKSNRNSDLYGEIEHDNLVINICNKYPRERQRQTIIHESLHGIDEEYQLGLNEKKIIVLANAIYAYIIDNKKFIKSIIENGN